MPLAINYEQTLEQALKALFPDGLERDRARERLQVYGSKPYHREMARVRLGILYLTSRDPGSFEKNLALACSDYRDLLCAAEYPYSSHPYGLRDKDPQKHRQLRDREDAEYLSWVSGIENA